MKCPNCGKKNYGNVERCFNCGTFLKPPQGQYQQPTYPVTIPPSTNPYPPGQPPPPQQQPPLPPLPIPPPRQQPQQPQVRTLPPPMPGTVPPPSGVQPRPPPGPPQNIVKPTGGICSQCNSNTLQFFDNGLGKCNNCGRTFEWLKPQDQPPQGIIDQYPYEDNSIPPEENPFIATEEEKLSVSERKAEVEPEEIFHDPMSSKIKAGTKTKETKEETPADGDLTDEQRLRMLEDRFLNGQISEATYKKLRSKFTIKILKLLEDKLVKGEITENEYDEKKTELE